MQSLESASILDNSIMENPKFEALGMLKKSDAGVRQQDLTAYTAFGRYGLIFPLLDKENTIVNYFTLRFNLETPKEEYLNSEGIYPAPRRVQLKSCANVSDFAHFFCP